MNTQRFLMTEEASAYYCHNLLIEVDFKWLMAGQGCWIDPNRMRSDQDYANLCLTSALNSGCEALRRCAVTLQDELDHGGFVVQPLSDEQG